MHALQLKKLSKYRAVQALLQTTTETRAIAPLPAKFAALNARLVEVDALAARQTQVTAGRTADHHARLAAMADAALEIAGLIGCYAAVHHLPELAAEVRVQPSDFIRTRLTQRPALAQRVHAAAAPFLAALAHYGVTPARLADLQDKIDDARQAVTHSRVAVCEQKAATARLTALFVEIDALLSDHIDRLLFPLRRSSLELYVTYRTLRATRGRYRILRQRPPAVAAALAATPTAARSADLDAVFAVVRNSVAALSAATPPTTVLPMKPSASPPLDAELRVA